MELTTSFVAAQQVYISTHHGPSPRLSCKPHAFPTPTYRFTDLSLTQTETCRAATSRPAPTTGQTYAPLYADYSRCHKNNLTPNITLSVMNVANPHGTASWINLGVTANVFNFTHVPLYTTTVTPTLKYRW